MSRLFPLLLLWLVSCGNDVSIAKQKVDLDEDGYVAEIDCDDGRKTVHPDAPELCDGLDNDCDEEIDEDADEAQTWYADADGDGYGDLGTATTSCSAPEGYVADSTDCDDQETVVHPGAPEVCDGLDNDCDGRVDADAVDATLWSVDRDGDGYGDPTDQVLSCTPPAGYVTDTTDCDDVDASVYPQAPEPDCTDPKDYNCDGSVAYADADGDGWAACEDCDDLDGTVNPSAQELCDPLDIDEDCSGAADDQDPTAQGTNTWYRDIDGDGYYPTGAASYTGCDQPPGYGNTPGDCDDGNAAISPAAQEVCDAFNADEDCDGVADDADPSVVGQGQWYTDGDGDGYAATGAARVVSCDAPANATTTAGDCNDSNTAISPAASEVCDALNTDEDCDGLVDDADPSVSGQQTWYRDNDGDGYAAIGASTLISCDTPVGYVSSGGDCDDSLASVSPAGTEVCDSLDRDEDCDGLADDDDLGATGQSTVYLDADYDGFGATAIFACDPSGNTVSNADDCDDSDVNVNPLVTEVCSDGIDNDCNGVDDPCGGCNPNNPTVTISTLNFNGMSYYMLSLNPCLPGYAGSCCGATTNQEEADAFCQLAGYCEATNMVVELKQSTSCYCYGSCTNNAWYSPCCSGSTQRYFITEVTCR